MATSRSSDLLRRLVPAIAAAISVALAVSIAQGQQNSVAIANAGLTLDVSLDDRTYLVDQRIETILCVANGSARPIEDLAPLHPRNGYLIMHLRNLSTGTEVGSLQERALLVVESAGTTLRAGESICEAINLLYWFGSRKSSGGMSYCLQSPTLPAGDYKLEVEYRVRLGGIKGLQQVTLRGQPVEFTIATLASNPQEADLVREFTAGCASFRDDGQSVGQHCRTWLPRFEHSPYYLLVYYNTRTLMTTIPLDSLLAVLDRRGEDGHKQAALVALRCKLEPLSLSDKIKWIEGLKNRRSDHLTQKVLNTWKQRSEESVPK